MTSVNLEKTLEYFNIKESLRSQNLAKYSRNIFICFSLLFLLRNILLKHKIKQITESARTF